MGLLVKKVIGPGIGLASEAYNHRKAKSASTSDENNTGNTRANVQVGESSRSSVPRPRPNEPPPEYAEFPRGEADDFTPRGQAFPADSKDPAMMGSWDPSSETRDEEQWQLDEAAGPSESAPGADAPQDPNAIAVNFLRSHPPPYSPTAKLPCPVILPQRRPRDMKRGFVRAYAPVLADCGIDQATFLEFLQDFHDATQASPWLTVVNLAAVGAGFAPSIIAMAVSTAVQATVGVAMAVQRRTRTNSYLDRMNNEFFRPRGLFCLIMAYKPDSADTHASVNITQTISSSLSQPSSGMGQTFGKLRSSSGKTYGEVEMPEAAPLIFPALDSLATETTESGRKKKSGFKSSQDFVADYVDRRAQAQYAGENPGSTLAAGEVKFTSRFADPNHPANSGSLMALVSGGAMQPRSQRGERGLGGGRRTGGLLGGLRSKIDGSANDRGQNRIRGGNMPGVRGKSSGGGRQSVVKRVLQADVLYMMIVNLPSDAELEAARRTVANQGSR